MFVTCHPLGGEIDIIIHICTYIYLLTLNSLLSIKYYKCVCVCKYTDMYILYTRTPSLEEYARKLLTEIAFARGTSGAESYFLPIVFCII